MIEIDTNTLINFEIQLICGAFWYFLFCLFDPYFHENAHAKKAEQLHPNMRTVIFIFRHITWRHKKNKGNRTIYYLPNSCKNEVYTDSMMLPEDNFSTCSDEEISAIAKAGVNRTRINVAIVIVFGLLLRLYVGIGLIFLIFLINMVQGRRVARKKMGWNDFQVQMYPSEFRDYYTGQVNTGEDGYDKMMAYGEQCLARNRKTK